MTLISPAATSPGHELPERMPARGRGRVLRELARRPLALVAAAYLAIVGILAIGASWLAPDSPQQEDLSHVLSGPSR
jgi:peptide/nickel transport system permease protein